MHGKSQTTVSQTTVLIVDDSAAVRQVLSDILNADPEITVLGTAGDPFFAANRIAHEVPNVIVLDIEMPRMDGLTFLRRIMAQHPIPVVICSSLTDENADVLVQAMERGAVDVISKPRLETTRFFIETSTLICDVVKAAGRAKLKRLDANARSHRVERKLTADAMLPPLSFRRKPLPTSEKVVFVGASTGGTEALREVLEVLPKDSPAIMIVQHMPENFTGSFARRLNTQCVIAVKEAEDGDEVLPGRALIAPGNHHLLLQRSGSRYYAEVRGGPLVSRHRPSVDVLFRSAAQNAGVNGVGIIMTGMGDDGAQGLLEMKQSGALTIAQNEESCVVFGMPKEAIHRGAADKVVPLDVIATEIVHVRSDV